MDNFDRRIVEEIPRLQRYARSLTRDVSRADDLVQDTLERALVKRALWQEGTNLRAWLFTILHNTHVNSVRNAAREGVSVDVEDVASMLVTQAHQEKRLELKDADKALSTLPKEQRQVILLIGLEGLNYEGAASVLRIPLGTVRSRLSRGRVALREKLNPIKRSVGRPRDRRLRYRYKKAATTLRGKGLELTHANLAHELGKHPKTIGNFLRRNPDLSNALDVVRRRLRSVTEYKDAVEKLVAKGAKATHKNIAIELGLAKRNTVTQFLREHPEIRSQYLHVLAPKREYTKRIAA